MDRTDRSELYAASIVLPRKFHKYYVSSDGNGDDDDDGLTVDRLPKILPDTVPHQNIKRLVNAKHIECNNCVPSIDDLLNVYPQATIWGVLNEIEYSANINFKHAKIANECNFKNGIINKERYYFNKKINLYYDSSKISTQYFENCLQTVGDVFTRIDYCVDRPSVASTKIKVVKSWFAFDKCSYKLTGSIEVDFPELQTINRLECFSRKRYFTYWGIQLTCNGVDYLFRVAFRRENVDRDDYECNIECEDLISGSNFIKCFDLLYKYYKHQYNLQDGFITPIIDGQQPATDCCNIEDLTDEQKRILATIRHVPWTETDVNPTYTPEVQVVDFIKYLGLETVLSYMSPSQRAATDLRCNVNFNHITFDKNKNQNVISDSETICTDI